MKFLNGTKSIATAVLVVCAFLTSSILAEVIHEEISSDHWFDLETGETLSTCANRRCPPIPEHVDFYFFGGTSSPILAHNSYTGDGRRIAILYDRPFDTVGFSDINTASFTTQSAGYSIGLHSTVILQTDTGAYYKIGNVVYSEVTDIVSFDYEELTGEVDAGRVFRDGFENPP